MRKITITLPPSCGEELYRTVCEGFRAKYREEELTFVRVNDVRLIGGFVADVDGVLIDASIKTQLSRMERHLKNR